MYHGKDLDKWIIQHYDFMSPQKMADYLSEPLSFIMEKCLLLKEIYKYNSDPVKYSHRKPKGGRRNRKNWGYVYIPWEDLNRDISMVVNR